MSFGAKGAQKAGEQTAGGNTAAQAASSQAISVRNTWQWYSVTAGKNQIAVDCYSIHWQIYQLHEERILGGTGNRKRQSSAVCGTAKLQDHLYRKGRVPGYLCAASRIISSAIIVAGTQEK